MIVFRVIILVLSLCMAAAAQNVAMYDSTDLSFNYPANWDLNDRSSVMVGQLNLSPRDGNALIIVLVYRKPLESDREFLSLKTFNVKLRTGAIAKDFSTYTESGACIDYGGHTFPGQRIDGILNGEPTTLYSVSFVIGTQFVNLMYLRYDKDAEKYGPVWSQVVSSLQLKGQKSKKEHILYDNESDAFLNGQALDLPPPLWPSGVEPYLSGVVDVRVTINEKGKVISAEPVSGDGRFRPQAVSAAKLAKFNPVEICGKPSQVTGMIRYNFVKR